ncbi:hypothetical protein [Nonomuraea sp. NPDC049684]|uniref:hypothetical protein n=1 Tax=Nonomuraea sp. NPDC049684 TaxID=3364356 RepID=UPI0037A5051D
MFSSQARATSRASAGASGTAIRAPCFVGLALVGVGGVVGGRRVQGGFIPVVAARRAVLASLLSEPSRNVLRAAVAESGPFPQGAWLTQRLARLPEADRPAAGLALLAARSPHDITETDVTAWHTTTSATDLVHLLGFGAITAVERIEEAVTSRTPTR